MSTETLSRTVLSSISDAVFVTDWNGRYTYICPNVAVIFGYDEVEVSRQGLIEALLGRLPPSPEEMERAGGEIENTELTITNKRGKRRDLLVSIKRVEIGEGKLLFACRDVTERRQAQRKLAESEARFRALSEQSHLGIAILVDGHIEYANNAFHTIFDRGERVRDLETLTAQFAPDNQTRPPEPGLDPAVGEHRLCGLQGEAPPGEREDGSEKWVEVYRSRLPFGGKEALCLTVADITERKRAATQRALAERRMAEADRLASTFELVAGLMHEVRNPGAAILGNVDLIDCLWQGCRPLLDRYLEESGDFSVCGGSYRDIREDVSAHIQGIRRAAEHVASTLGDLQAYARGGAERGPLDVNQAVRSTLILGRPFVRRAGAQVEAELAPGLPRVKAGRQSIEQVLLNLLKNACEAIDEADGRIRVRTALTPAGLVEITIEDNGSGIPAEHVPRVKQPYFTTKRDRGGTGLGLAVSESIVREYGGKLDLQPRPGGGTRAVIRLRGGEDTT